MMDYCTVDPDTFRFKCGDCGMLHPHYEVQDTGMTECRHRCGRGRASGRWSPRMQARTRRGGGAQ